MRSTRAAAGRREGGRDRRGNGSICDGGIDSRTISLSLETLKNSHSVLCCIANPETVPALSAALKAGYIDVLVIDSVSAGALLSFTGDGL